MKKTTKFFLSLSVICLIAGGVLTVAGYSVNGGKGVTVIWNHGLKLEEPKVCELEKTAMDKFSDIDLDITFAEINFQRNDTDEYAVAYKLEAEEVKCESVNNKLIVADKERNVGIINFSGFNLDSSEYYLTIYYPENAEFGDITVNSSAGSIKIPDGLKCNSMHTDASAGSLKLKDFEGALNHDSSAGSFFAENCVFTKLELDMSAGSADLDNCVVGGGVADMSAGSFEASGMNLTGNFTMDMSAGSTEIELVSDNDIGYDFDVSAGSIYIDGQKVAGNDDYHENTDADIILIIDSSAGSVKVNHK